MVMDGRLPMAFGSEVGRESMVMLNLLARISALRICLPRYPNAYSCEDECGGLLHA